jgi:hypothetical protein
MATDTWPLVNSLELVVKFSKRFGERGQPFGEQLGGRVVG